jgi:hypothetical protein
MRFLLLALSAFCFLTPAYSDVEKDLRTKEQRLYDIKLRNAQWEVDRKQLDKDTNESTFVEVQELFKQNISTLEELNRREREYRQAQLVYDQAVISLENTRLSFLRDATHIAIREAKKYRTAEGRRQIEITLENASNLIQAMSLNPDKSTEDVSALLEIQNILVSIEGNNNLIIAEPYEITIPSLKLNERKSLTFRLLSDHESVRVSLTLLDNQVLEYPIVLRRESLQDIPTINSVQFSQEGELNSRVKYDIILERLAEDEKNFRLAVVNLPKEIDLNFIDPSTSASLTQIKFSEETTRQQLELEVQIPEKLSRRFVDETIEFYVFITDKEGFQQVGELNREFANKPIPLEKINTIKGNKERFELIPRGKGKLETIISNRYQEIKTGEQVVVRVDLLNTGTLEVEGVHLILTPPLGWTYAAVPDTLRRILPGEKEPVNITLTPPSDLGVSEYDVRVEAAGFVGNERVDAQEKDLTIRVEARANILRNVLIIGGVIGLVVGVAVVSIKVSRR